MDEMNNLRTFVAVIVQGGFSKAAKVLDRPPSSVSRSIAALEKLVGTSLFYRSTRQVRLTEAGKVYYERVKNALAELGEAQNAITELQSVPSGLLRIEAREALGRRIIAPVLNEFCSLYPRIRISLRLSDTADDKLHDGVDVILRYGKGEQGDAYFRRILATHRILVASPTILQEGNLPQDPGDLKAFRCIAYTGGGAVSTWRFRKGQQVIEMPFVAILEVNDTDALVTAARSGLGVGLVPDWVVREELEEKSLVRICGDYDVSLVQEFEAPIYALYDKATKSAKVSAFVEFLSEFYSSEEVSVPAVRRRHGIIRSEPKGNINDRRKRR